MATRTRAQLLAEIAAAIEDNDTGAISAADVRQRLLDLADSAKLAEDLTGFAPLLNPVFSDGLSMGAQTAASITDLSKHLDLWDGAYGANVTTNLLNHIAPVGAAHSFVVDGISRVRISADGITSSYNIVGKDFRADRGDGTGMYFFGAQANAGNIYYNSGSYFLWRSGVHRQILDSGNGIYNNSANSIGAGWNGVQPYFRVDGTDFRLMTTTDSIKSLRRGLDLVPYIQFTDNSVQLLQAYLGYTPVRQGGGSGMSTNVVYIGWDNAGALLCQVDSVPLGKFVFQAVSDERVKTDIAEPEETALDKINRLRLISFNFSSEGYGETHHRDPSVRHKVGFSAQELEKVEPGWVRDIGIEDLKGPDADKLLPYLVKAIQELSAEVAELRSRL